MTLIFKKISITVLITLATMTPMFAIAQVVDDSAKSVVLQLEGQCDKANNKLWLKNQHETKSVLVTVRWNLAGSKRLITDKFQVMPGTRREIGCAAQADVVSTEFIAP